MLRTVAILGLLLSGSAPLYAGPPTPLPSDLAVTFTAEPDTNLLAGQPIALSLSITNLGTEPLDRFALVSSPMVGELWVRRMESGCDGMAGAIVDLEDSSYFLLSWHISEYLGTGPLPAGETRTCRMSAYLTPTAPPSTSFSFELSSNSTDPNPSNNVGTVVLGRAFVGVPMLSPIVLALLAVLLAACAGRVARRPRAARRE
jgi:hypothetical protein